LYSSVAVTAVPVEVELIAVPPNVAESWNVFPETPTAK
jgi:hypothetical protein